MPLEVYANLEKMSCDLCGKLEKPSYTITLVGTRSKADICSGCYQDSMKHEPFLKGIEKGEIQVTERGR